MRPAKEVIKSLKENLSAFGDDGEDTKAQAIELLQRAVEMEELARGTIDTLRGAAYAASIVRMGRLRNEGYRLALELWDKTYPKPILKAEVGDTLLPISVLPQLTVRAVIPEVSVTASDATGFEMTMTPEQVRKWFTIKKV